MKAWPLILLLISGCKFVIDDGEDNSKNFQTEEANRTYEASLASTDVKVPGIVGTSKVDIQGDVVNVNLELNGVPQNITQIHYGYIAADCSSLQLALPSDINGTRTVKLNEDITLTALQNDVAASGSALVTGDTDLGAKSFVVKAFTVLNSVPNAIGTNTLTIACGRLNLTSSGDTGETTDKNPE